MLADVRYALRQLARSPGFAAAAVLTLALGAGAATAIFSVADAVLLRPLPYPEARRLVLVWDQLSKIGVERHRLSALTSDAYRDDHTIFEASAIFKTDSRTLSGPGGAERVSVLSASPELFDMLGVRGPAADGVVLSHSFFARRFGADASRGGQTIRLDDRAWPLTSVLPADFEFGLGADSPDVWTLLPSVQDRGAAQFAMLARLRPGVAIDAAREAVAAAAKHLDETVRPYRGPNGEDPGYHAIVVPLREQLYGNLRTGTLLLAGAVGLLLLIACVNVANLLVARSAAREREIAVRRALGASRARLVRQWITEAAVLAVLGGATGLLASGWGVALLKGLSPERLPGIARAGIDSRVLVFSLAVTVLTCLLSGLAPALAATRVHWGLRGSTHPRRRLAGALVAVEVALALMLLAGAGLLARSFVNLRRVDPGFAADRLLTFEVQAQGPRFNDVRRRRLFFAQLSDRLSSLPGVISASTVSRLPLFRAGANTRNGNPFSLDGHPWNPDNPALAHTQTAGLRYFRTMEIPLRAGREFAASDTADTPRVAIVNQTLARRYFPRGDAIGRRLLLGAPEPGARWMTIVGIVGDVRTGAIDDSLTMPQFYTPVAQDESAVMEVVVRTAVDPLLLSRPAGAAVHAIDPDATTGRVRGMQEHIAATAGEPRFQAVLLGFFAIAAILLAGLGIYGVVAHATIQRTREIGIQMALGATAGRVIGDVLASGMRPVAAGAVLGLAGGLMGSRVLASVLYDVAPRDPAAFAWAVAVLGLVALTACLAPAVHAAKVDPAAALRE